MDSSIDGVYIHEVKTIVDDRGSVMIIPTPPFDVKHVYATTVRQGAIKAWHGYITKTLYWTVVKGIVQLALYDNRTYGKTLGITDTLFLGENSNYSVLVPPGVFNGFKGISTEDAIIVVQADEPYGQITRIPVQNGMIDYDWRRKDG